MSNTSSLISSARLTGTSLTAAKKLFLKARKEYFNDGASSLTDAEFDSLEENIRKSDPEWEHLKKTGAAPEGGRKYEIELFAPMPSLAKIQDDDESKLLKFISLLRKEASVSKVRISSKIDGSSVQMVYLPKDKPGVLELTHLITRGDGSMGKSISHFIPHISGVPKVLKTKKPMVIARCEAAVPISLWERKWQEEFDSSRVMASALFNRIRPYKEALEDVRFVLLSLIVDEKPIPPHDLQGFANRFGFPLPDYSDFHVDDVTVKSMRSLLTRFVTNRNYELDGLVISPISDEEICLEYSEKLPRYTKAFKVNDEESAPKTKIKEIVWNASSFGVLVPKAIIEPVKFGNVTVTQAALHNVAWAQERGIGVGAVVRVLRSGEIIPKIVRVLEPKEFHFPDKRKYGPYTFDGVRIILTGKENTQVLTNKINRMFNTLKLDSIGSGFAEKLVEAGYANTYQLPRLSLEEIQNLPGIKTSASKIYQQLQRITSGEFTLPKLMLASGVFSSGMGSSRLQVLWKEYPEAFDMTKSLDTQKVSTLLGPVTSSVFIKGRDDFILWLHKAKMSKDPSSYATPSNVKKVKGPLTGQFFSFTGYRSSDQEALVTQLGGEVIPFGSKTTTLFYKPDGKSSSKVEKAGKKATTFDQWSKSVLPKVNNE